MCTLQRPRKCELFTCLVFGKYRQQTLRDFKALKEHKVRFSPIIRSTNLRLVINYGPLHFTGPGYEADSLLITNIKGCSVLLLCTISRLPYRKELLSK